MFKSKWDDNSSSGIGDTLYSGAATFGLFWATVVAIVGTLIGIGLLGSGIALWTRKEKFSVPITGKVIDAQCAPITQGNQQVQQCALKIEYVVDGKPYVYQTTRSDQFYAKDYNVSLRYDPENPVEATMDGSVKTAGKIMSGVGIVIIIGVWVNFYIKRRFKFAAAAGGVGQAVDMIRF